MAPRTTRRKASQDPAPESAHHEPEDGLTVAELRARLAAFEAAGAREERVPPEDRDERLATFLRGPEEDPGETELRVSWASFNGRPYLRFHTWKRCGTRRLFWPVRGASLTVRRRELRRFAAAILAALDRSAEFEQIAAHEPPAHASRR